MAGKTTKPLRIVVHDSLADLPEIRVLGEQGHEIEQMGWITSAYDLNEADMIIGPNCWRMPADCIKYLAAAIKAARAVVYGPTKGAKDGGGPVDTA